MTPGDSELEVYAHGTPAKGIRVPGFTLWAHRSKRLRSFVVMLLASITPRFCGALQSLDQPLFLDTNGMNHLLLWTTCFCEPPLHWDFDSVATWRVSKPATVSSLIGGGITSVMVTSCCVNSSRQRILKCSRVSIIEQLNQKQVKIIG